MGVTRDPDYPSEMASLMEAFNRCADGHDANIVLNAAMQMTIATINYHARARGHDREQMTAFCQQVLSFIAMGVSDNFQRNPQLGDVPVMPQ